MLHSSFFARSLVFAHVRKAQLPFLLFSETFLTIRQNSLNVTVCMIARSSYRGYFIHSLSTLYYYNALSLATRLTGDYRDRTCTGKCGPASLDTPHKKDILPDVFLCFYRARDGTRTRGPDLGKVVLHQLSHSCIYLSVPDGQVILYLMLLLLSTTIFKIFQKIVTVQPCHSCDRIFGVFHCFTVSHSLFVFDSTLQRLS